MFDFHLPQSQTAVNLLIQLSTLPFDRDLTLFGFPVIFNYDIGLLLIILQGLLRVHQIDEQI